MQILYDAIASLIAFFYSLIPNYAVAIILMTIVVMVVLTPLTLKSTRSMMVMQQFQPEIKRLQQKYKDDMQRRNEELMKFYKENNISPWGGCLPLLLQMPVFLVLYAVLRGLTRPISDMGFNSGFHAAQSALGQAATASPTFERPFDPAYLDHSTALWQSLAGQTQMKAFGMDLANSASDELGVGILVALPYFILIAIVLVSSIVQQRQIQGRQTNKDAIPQQQQAIMKFMPLMLPIFSFGLPAGLVTYFATSNIYRVGQQWFISRNVYGVGKDGPGAALAGKSSAKVVTTTAEAAESDDASESPKRKRSLGDAGDPATPAASSNGGTKKKKPSGAPSSAKRAGKQPAASERSAGRNADRSKKNDGKGGRDSGTTDQGPVLQPRARKRKR
jgi:YidC/Oxa1 family membrane protein insertase